jgi:hypothetical protein
VQAFVLPESDGFPEAIRTCALRGGLEGVG